MATIETSCPYCGANITIDNDWESAFCMYCGNEIGIKQTVIPESQPEPQPQPETQPVIEPEKTIVIKHPSAAPLVIGIILTILNGLWLCSRLMLFKTFALIMLLLGIFLIVWYIYRNIKYDKDVKQAQKNGYSIKNK